MDNQIQESTNLNRYYPSDKKKTFRYNNSLHIPMNTINFGKINTKLAVIFQTNMYVDCDSKKFQTNVAFSYVYVYQKQ